MSRSAKASPFCGFTLKESEQDWKAETSRALRRAVHVMLYRSDPDSMILPCKHEIRSQWGPKDGKQRFNPDRHPELMRK